MDDEIRDAITNAMPKDHLRKLVYGGNVVTLLQDGLGKVIEGETSFSEILKAVDLDNDLGNYEEDNLKNSLNDIEVNKATHELQTTKPTVEIINYSANIPKNLDNKTVVPTLNQQIKTTQPATNLQNIETPTQTVQPTQVTNSQIQQQSTVKPVIQPVQPKTDIQFFNA